MTRNFPFIELDCNQKNAEKHSEFFLGQFLQSVNAKLSLLL